MKSLTFVDEHEVLDPSAYSHYDSKLGNTYKITSKDFIDVKGVKIYKQNVKLIVKMVENLNSLNYNFESYYDPKYPEYYTVYVNPELTDYRYFMDNKRVKKPIEFVTEKILPSPYDNPVTEKVEEPVQDDSNVSKILIIILVIIITIVFIILFWYIFIKDI